MAGNPFYQSLDPAAAPDPVTPQASPGDAAGWAQVTPTGIGQAPYDIGAPQDIPGITQAVNAAGALSGAGVVYPRSARQAEAEAILESPQGAQAMNVTTGFPDYENTNVSPGAALENPIQGYGTYPGTTQDGIPQFPDGLGTGVTGVTPEAGSMGGGPGIGYPGTTQDGLTKYGASG